MEIVNASVKSALEQLLALHKHATSDMEFMDSGFDIIQTLLNNIHMAQSHMFASLVGNVTKQYPVALNPINNTAMADDTNIDEYMSQFSNVSISAKNKIESPTTVLSPSLNKFYSAVIHKNPQPIVKKGEGPIDRWLREQRQEEANHDIDIFEKEHYLAQPNMFNDDDPYNTEGPYNPGAWHDKINVDVEQCCARIGRQLFMIDHMEPEFLDNYPSDTHIDENGFVHGRACLRTIDTNLFNTGQIFCNDHAYGYEDIRKPPTCASPDINFM
jgi:hypothetical protein